jgi:hypothetical protein
VLRRPALLAAAPLVISVAALAGCTPTIGVPAAEDAANPRCAEVMLTLPDELGGDLPQVSTDAQATTAWGRAGAAVTLRCGVTPPGPSADCQQVESQTGTVDWIVQAGQDGTWRFVTYGRDPAVEVLVPPAITEDHSTSFIGDLAPAVSKVEATEHCS